MAGFLLVAKDPAAPVLQGRVERTLRVFAKRGLKEARRIARPGFDLYLFQKLLSKRHQLLEFADGDFIAATGTLIYRGKSGTEALAALYDDFRAGFDVDRELMGNYCVLLTRAGRLTLFCDRSGFMRIYHDPDFRVISNSFLAVAYGSPKLTVSPHELYEYVFYGFFFKTKTLFEEVRILDHAWFWHLYPPAHPVRRAIYFQDFPDNSGFDSILGLVRENLLDYFSTLRNAFGGSFACALSGGYDTRLLLAILRKLAFPVHLYVYGDAASKDVRVAKCVCRGEGLSLDHGKRETGPAVPIQLWFAHLEKQFYFFDGAKPLGLFDNGSDLESRLDRVEGGRLHLNGAGGEIYREIWHLGDCGVSISDFLRNMYDFGRYDFCTEAFDKGEFFLGLEAKIAEILETRADRLTRTQVEMLFPSLRNLFASSNVMANNQIGDAILPYAEPRFVHQSYRIPLRYKYDGRFQAALIQSLDPALARYTSAYGYNFRDPIPVKARLESKFRRYLPVPLRVLVRRMHTEPKEPSLWLQGDYYTTVFGRQDLAIRKYFRPELIRDPSKLLRAFTAELLLGDYFRGSA
jgi:hypothetical protein